MKNNGMHTFLRTSTFVALLTIGTLLSNAKDAPGKSTVEEMNEYLQYNNAIVSPPHFTYLPDGKQYALLSQDRKVVETYEIATGKKTGELIDLNHVRETQLSNMSGFIISPDASKVIVYRNRKSVYRRSSTAEYYVYEVRSRLLRPLSKKFARTSIPTFSPDSRMVAFVADNNIYIKKIDFDTEVAVTTDGEQGKIINGATDWTYEEEFSVISTLAWAPDNSLLCYVKFNETDVPMYSLPLYEGTCEVKPQYALYPGELSYKYPVAGEKNSIVSVHSYDVDTRKTLDLNIPRTDLEYIPRLDFGPSAEQLLVSTLNRDQNHYEIYRVNPRANVAKSLFSEKSQAWICSEMYEQLAVGKDAFVVFSNRSGHMHLYQYSYSGQLMKTITNGDFDVTAYYGADLRGNHYFQRASENALNRTVSRTEVKTGRISDISPVEGTSSATFSPLCQYMVLSHNSSTSPVNYTLCDNNGKNLRVLADNSEYGKRMLAQLPQKEFITVPSDGNQLNCWIMRPKNFDASKKYPVVMYQYSGPGSQSVSNSWEVNWIQFFADHGYIVACVDGRGTGQRGNDFMYCVYKNLGYYETIDQVNAARYIATLPGVDASRIAIFGWSFGGYEALMCATAENNPFAAAVAVAPVTDWRYYDTVYAERYMLTPNQNETGYKDSAPTKRAEKLNSELLIMYGTADDNVHPVNSLQMASQLQTDGILFDMMVFPNKNHSINGCNSRADVYSKMYHFLNKAMNVNP